MVLFINNSCSRVSAFSTSAVFRSGAEDKTPEKLLAETGEVMVVNPTDNRKRLPYQEQRRLEDDSIPRHVVSNIP